MLAWVLLLIAVAVEVAGTASLPRTEGFTDLRWSAFVLGCYAAAIVLLSIIVRTLPVAVAYAVWSGAGTALVAVVAYYFLDEPMTLLKATSLGLIVLGVIGLNLAGTH
ncbi:MAG: multidrug efflux SMR transporter [Nocardioides sp.]